MRHDTFLFSVFLMSVSLGGAVLSGCFQPELPTGQFKCDQPGDACPEGMACISGLCRSRVDDPTTPPAVDMAMAPTPMSVKGCSGSGVMIANMGGKDAHACAGNFPVPSGSATSLCASGYHLCKSSDRALLFEARSSGRCDTLSIDGFFAADILAGYDGTGALVCEPRGAVATPALVGCGQETGVRTIDPPCNDLPSAAPCDGTVNGWTCTSNLSTATHAAGKPGGVLCCKD